MTRNIEKAIKDYRKRLSRSKGNQYAIYASDIDQIIDIATTSGKASIHRMVASALQAGFEIGYRTAERELKKPWMIEETNSPGNTYMRTADIPKEGLKATIKEICIDKPPICYFEEEDLNPLILNKTNLKAISEICGSNSIEDFRGVTIHLSVKELTTIKKELQTIRIEK